MAKIKIVKNAQKKWGVLVENNGKLLLNFASPSYNTCLKVARELRRELLKWGDEVLQGRPVVSTTVNVRGENVYAF